MKTRHCLICRTIGKPMRQITDTLLRPHYNQNYPQPVPKDIDLGRYTIYRCPKCLLEWADPMAPGSNPYYTWLTRHPGYYPKDRWEWQLVFQLIPKSKHTTLLEVGCGSGKFLSYCLDHGIKATGIDTTKESVVAAKEQKLDAINLSLEQYCKSTTKKYDYVVAFHLLEHVSNPVGLIKQMKSLLKPNGRIFLSTPYITANFQSQWFDYLNYPPHHLTRWCLNSYQHLADSLHLSIKTYMPMSIRRTSFQRLVSQLKLIAIGPSSASNITLPSLLKFALAHPQVIAKEILLEVAREKVKITNPNNPDQNITQKADYVILVELISS